MSNLEGANTPAPRPALTARSLRLTTKQPARDPNPATKATALTYLIFERPDLDRSSPSGFSPISAFARRRGTDRPFLRVGTAPDCYVVERGPQARFVGLGLSVASLDDLTKLAAYLDASLIEDVELAGRRQAGSHDRSCGVPR